MKLKKGQYWKWEELGEWSVWYIEKVYKDGFVDITKVDGNMLVHNIGRTWVHLEMEPKGSRWTLDDGFEYWVKKVREENSATRKRRVPV